MGDFEWRQTKCCRQVTNVKSQSPVICLKPRAIMIGPRAKLFPNVIQVKSESRKLWLKSHSGLSPGLESYNTMANTPVLFSPEFWARLRSSEARVRHFEHAWGVWAVSCHQHLKPILSVPSWISESDSAGMMKASSKGLTVTEIFHLSPCSRWFYRSCIAFSSWVTFITLQTKTSQTLWRLFQL